MEVVGSMSRSIPSNVVSLRQQVQSTAEPFPRRLEERNLRSAVLIDQIQRAPEHDRADRHQVTEFHHPDGRECCTTVLEIYMRPSWLHEKANDAVRDLIRREDENTSKMI